ncbi:hypothetical protein [Caldilinea sp.]|uniref:hypothetical protein n=1 Tax=Caldilinea sp. TaxID=2293560 RepID=UPI002CFECA6B|nr:hypothetical protein [Anaerolineales bacterium]HQY90737.1 hypothetical protein [Caldilinea sp.]HRA65785.1 hypothetical protein [Caldilinea sp.]
MAHTAMFTGLVFDPEGHVAEVTWVGENACYVVYEDDFKRHIDAEMVDRQVLRFMRQQVEGSRDLAVGAMLDMMGRDDLFTKAAVESTIDRMEDAVGQPIPEDARQWLGMLGFKIVIDDQGAVVDIQMPAGGIDEGDGD